MAEVLGHDCAGRPLHVGDVVEVIQDGLTQARYVGLRCTVVGVASAKWQALYSMRYRGTGAMSVALVVRVADGMRGICNDRGLRRIDDRPEAGTWDDVRRTTGWSPQPQREHEEA